MNKLLEQRFDRALRLRNIIIHRATHSDMDEDEFRLLRSDFLNDPNTKQLLPQFVRDNVDEQGLWAYLKDFHTGGGAYAARRTHISEQFQPLLNYLSEIGAPADAGITNVISNYGAQGISDIWSKTLDRRKTDPEGAITAARTLLEEVCKHILDDIDEDYQEKWDLPKLYSKVSKIMNLAPSSHTEDTFKRILGGCQNVVENLGGLRNKISDAHGGGRHKVRPSERHAALAVNLAGSMAMFLIETWETHQAKAEIHNAKTKTQHLGKTHKGVHLESRHNLPTEIADMERIVDTLVPDMQKRLERIFCDSKATATYSVTVSEDLWDPEIQWAMKSAIISACGGHNGVYFEGDAPNGIDLDPDWPDLNL